MCFGPNSNPLSPSCIFWELPLSAKGCHGGRFTSLKVCRETSVRISNLQCTCPGVSETRSMSWFQCPCHPAMPVASSLSSASPQLMGVIVPRVTTFDRRMITQGKDTSSFCVRRPVWLEPKEKKDKRGDKLYQRALQGQEHKRQGLYKCSSQSKGPAALQEGGSGFPALRPTRAPRCPESR